jgi:hypothetical protein
MIVETHNSLGALTWKNHYLTAAGWSEAIGYSLWISQLSVILALIIWLVAYRKSDL